MTSFSADPEHYHLEEGHVCVDFVNTDSIQVDPAAPHGYQPIDEHLPDLPALGRWGRELGMLSEAEAAVLTAEPAGADHARLDELRSARESVRRLIRAHLRAEPLPVADLEAINRIFAPLLDQTRLVAGDDGFQRAFAHPAPHPDLERVLDHVTWTIGQSTFDLLTDPDELAMIRECPADDCGYLFRDTSHGRRRWCSMKSCGNRAKVQRFRERQAKG